MKSNDIKNYVGLLLVIALGYFAIAPFFSSGFFPMHDDTQVARVFAMQKSLADGMFPVRWVADLGYGYGYPIFNFYAPLAYYIGAIFNSIGFDSLISTKIMMALGVILSGISMYLFSRVFFGERAGVLAGLLYLYAPYHAVEIYVRGDVTEFWAYGFIPLVFWGVYNVYRHKSWTWISIAAFSYAGLILSHNLTAFMVTPFLFLFALLLFVNSRTRMSWRNALLPGSSLLLGILVATFYWLPTLAEMQYTNILSQVAGTVKYQDHFVCLQQLWDSPWAYGGTAKGCIDGMSFKLGKLHLILAGVAILFAVCALILRKKISKVTYFAIGGLGFSLFVLFPVSLPLWENIPLMSFFQYPWRFLIIASFFSAFLAGFVWWVIEKKITQNLFRWIVTILFAVLIIFINAEVFVPQTQLTVESDDYTNNEAVRWSASKLTDEYLPVGFDKPKSLADLPEEKIQKNQKMIIRDLQEKTQKISFSSSAKEKTDLVFNHAYFPAWQVFIDGEKKPYRFFEKGIIITVPSGNHEVVLQFVQTPIERMANVLSLTGILILFVGIISQRRILRHA